MTLISFATYGDHAEFITDTTSYTRYVEQLGITTKHATLNHLDAAVLTQGCSTFGDYATVGALKLAGDCAGFDEMVGRYQATLVATLADLPEVGDRDCTAFLLGYSENAAQFVAYVYAAEQGFKPLRVTQWLMPTPWSLRPSGIELRRVREVIGHTPLWPQVEPRWTTQPKMVAPRSVEEWVDLALIAHEQRTADHYFQILVLGSVLHTRLERGASLTRRVHNFEHTTEEFRAILAGTRHPIGQMQDCHCGSGETYRDCHLRPYWTDACGCASGRTFYECCMVPEAADVTV